MTVEQYLAKEREKLEYAAPQLKTMQQSYFKIIKELQTILDESGVKWELEIIEE